MSEQERDDAPWEPWRPWLRDRVRVMLRPECHCYEDRVRIGMDGLTGEVVCVVEHGHRYWIAFDTPPTISIPHNPPRPVKYAAFHAVELEPLEE